MNVKSLVGGLVLTVFCTIAARGQVGGAAGTIGGEVDDSSGGKVAGAKIEITGASLPGGAR
jgi:hypothetical protein